MFGNDFSKEIGSANSSQGLYILWCLVCECEPSDGGYIVDSRSNRLLQIRTTERPVPKDKGRDVN